jgi:hypothetical protein
MNYKKWLQEKLIPNLEFNPGARGYRRKNIQFD